MLASLDACLISQRSGSGLLAGTSGAGSGASSGAGSGA